MRYWQHVALLYHIEGTEVLVDVTNGNIPFLFLVNDDAKRLLSNEDKQPLTVKMSITEEDFYYHRVPQDIPERLFFAMEGWIEDVDLVQVFDNELGLYISRDFFISAVVYRNGPTFAKLKAQYLQACEKAGVVLSVGHSRRHQTAARKIKSFIDDGTLGQVITAEANLSYGMAQTLDDTKWRSNRTESPGGPLTSLGIHHLDTLAYLLGPVARISAFSKRLMSPVDIDDAVTAILEFESGALGYVGSNFATPRVFYLNVYGTEANVFLEAEGAKLSLQKKGSEEREPVDLGEIVDILLEEMEEFGRCVRDGTRPEVSGEEALRAIAAIEAIVRSSEEGRTIALAELLN